jgi:DNA-binding NarL/FixJ family response regulator
VADGRALIEAGEARVALMDLGLPDGDGTDLIRLATDRSPPISTSIARYLLRRFRGERPQPEAAEATVHLTPRELEVLEVVSRGYNNARSARCSACRCTRSTHTSSVSIGNWPFAPAAKRSSKPCSGG